MPMQIMVGKSPLTITHHADAKIDAAIPYFFSLGAISVAGVLYLRDPIENSYTDGAFAGVVTGTYHLDRNNPEACVDNGLLKACIMVDFAARKVRGRLCSRRPFDGWDCSDWHDILSW